jgi:hypothetical protein
MKKHNSFHAIAKMIEDNSPNVRASTSITDVKTGRTSGKITMQIDNETAQNIMRTMTGLSNSDLVVVLLVVDKDELTETRKRLDAE